MDTKRLEMLIASTYSREEYPVSIYQTEKWRRTQPLKGLRVIDVTPVFRNTLVKHLALIAAGAQLIVGVSDLLPCDQTIVELLSSCGIQIVKPNDDPFDVDIILDCAAAFCLWTPRIGFVELTRSGVDKFGHTDKPVFVADNGHIKRIETCLGTGESYFRAMKQLGHEHWAGSKLVVFGSGKVGSGIILYAHKKGANVSVVTELSDAVNGIEGCVSKRVREVATQIIDYKDLSSVADAVRTAYAVVTATGVRNALEGNCPPEALINSTALLANMGVEDEYGCSVPEDRVLMGKRTLNFILDEPTHMKYIDATMALHNEGAVYLEKHRSATGLIEPPTELEEELLNVCRLNGCISDELDLLY